LSARAACCDAGGGDICYRLEDPIAIAAPALAVVLLFLPETLRGNIDD
jgi:hypothetical protein